MIAGLAPADVAVAALLLTALVTDLRRQRVPNLLTFGGMALGLAANTLAGDPLVGLVGLAVAFALAFPGWLLGGSIRAGDAKLLMAMGAFYGGGEALRACLLTYMLALPYGLAVLAFRGRLGGILPALRAGIRRGLGGDAPEPDLTVVPFVPVVAAAVLVTRTTEVLRWF